MYKTHSHAHLTTAEFAVGRFGQRSHPPQTAWQSQGFSHSPVALTDINMHVDEACLAGVTATSPSKIDVLDRITITAHSRCQTPLTRQSASARYLAAGFISTLLADENHSPYLRMGMNQPRRQRTIGLADID